MGTGCIRTPRKKTESSSNVLFFLARGFSFFELCVQYIGPVTRKKADCCQSVSSQLFGEFVCVESAPVNQNPLHFRVNFFLLLLRECTSFRDIFFFSAGGFGTFYFLRGEFEILGEAQLTVRQLVYSRNNFSPHARYDMRRNPSSCDLRTKIRVYGVITRKKTKNTVVHTPG